MTDEFGYCKYGGIDPDVCFECKFLNYDVDDGIYTNFWCTELDRNLDDELQGRVGYR